MSINYRKADTCDAGSLADLRAEQIVEEGGSARADIRSELEKQFAGELSDDSLTIMTALEGEIMIGMACYSHLRNEAYVTNVYVSADHRRQKIATRLMDMITDDAAAHGCDIMCLRPTEQGRKLYEKTGFTNRGGFMVKPLK